MATIYYEKDCDPALIKGKKVAVIGYGSQGHAHALNLHDSGVDVRVGLRTGSKSWDKAKEAGLKVMTPREAAAEADLVMILTPGRDRRRTRTTREIHESMTAGKALAFAHGFNIHFDQIVAARGRRRHHDRPQGPRPHGAPRLHRGLRRAEPHRRPPGRDRQGAGTSRCRTRGASAARAPASSRPPSPRRPRPTSSASRSCSAAA